MWHFFIFKLHHIKLFINFLFYQLLMRAPTIFLPLYSETSIYSMQTYIEKLPQMQNKSIVSIQLLFLFNYHSSSASSGWVCFNTASVLIQHNTGNIIEFEAEFQYSFCSYSTKVLGGKCTLTTSFNTASVLIQPTGANLSNPDEMFQYSFCSYSTRMSRGTR